MERNSVTVEFQDNRYVVRVVEDGEVTRRDFEVEKFAEAWAKGQRVRLGLPIDNREAAE